MRYIENTLIMKPPIALVVVACLLVIQTHAQFLKDGRTEINIGASSTDAINAGFQYRFGQSEVGFNVGRLFTRLPGYRFIAFSPSFHHHLWGKSKWTDLKPWYAKVAATNRYFSMRNNPDFGDQRGRDFLLRVHLGRDFNFSKRTGFTASIGPCTTIYWNSNSSSEDENGFVFSIAPSLDLSFYYQM